MKELWFRSVQEPSKLLVRALSNGNISSEHRTYKSDEFIARHIGPRENDKKIMLDTMGCKVRKRVPYF